MKDLIISILLYLAMMVLLVFLWPAPAQSQMIMTPMPCGPTDKIIDMIKNKYGEQVIGFGPTRANDLVRLYVSEKTFTVLITLRDGTSCMAAAGDIWETLTRGQPT